MCLLANRLVAKGWHQSSVSMSLKPENVYGIALFPRVYVVCCDVHFRYSDDAFMWTV